jgi:hypothetical protein
MPMRPPGLPDWPFLNGIALLLLLSTTLGL